MFSAAASSKVEPLDDSRWDNDSPATLSLLKDSPPSSPRTPLLSGDVGRPSNGLKLGYPFKGSLKRSQQRAYVPPSLEDDKITGVVQDDVVEQDSNVREKRSIKWLDNYGKELIEVKEFDASDCEDSDEEEYTSCTCAIQ